MRAGDKVICIKTKNYGYITLGKKYIVKYIVKPSFYDATGIGYYYIINDANYNERYEDDCFINIREERSKKLKKIGMIYE